MSVELGTDRDDRVYARWAPGGPWTVLDRDGRVTTEPHALLATPYGIAETEDEPDPNAGYDEGYDDGFADAISEASSAVDSVSGAGPRKRKPAPIPTPRRSVVTATASGGAL